LRPTHRTSQPLSFSTRERPRNSTLSKSHPWSLLR
jgi:hypothetical protein